MSNTTIAIEDQGTLWKITKIVPYRRGGFAVLAPYHQAKCGHLLKPTVDYSKREMAIGPDDAIEFSVEDRVKLSLHPDGFAQFSGENPGKILSGRDRVTGEPKGLGVMSRPLDAPINTGPTFACVVWGLSEFEPLGSRSRDTVIFSEEDYYYRRCTPDTWNGYVIEAFVLEDRYWGAVRKREGKLTLAVMPMFEAIGAVIELRVVPLPGQPLLLGLMVSKLTTSFAVPSGFTLNGPSDLKTNQVLHAVYPAPEDLGLPRLDYGQ